MSILDDLKKNCYAFGMWPDPKCYGPELGKEMQEKALAIGFHGNFRLFVGPGFGGIIDNPTYIHGGHLIYRLRPDYQEEPEIEECEIYGDKRGELSFYRDRREDFVSYALDHPDFIGFKFEDGVMANSPIRYSASTGIYASVDISGITDYKVLHATHVLFRR